MPNRSPHMLARFSRRSAPLFLMIQRHLSIAILGGLLVTLGVGCDTIGIDDRGDPNQPSLEGTIQNPTRDKIANVATGIEAGMRTDLNLYLTDVGVIGREYIRFSGSEPRFTSELLGGENSVLDNNTFYITRPWAERYRVVRNANVLIEALGNAGPGILSDAEKNAARGFAKTVMAHQLLLNANLTFRNGIRVDVAGDEPGPLVEYSEALQAIADTLDDANQALQGASDEFPFSLTSGFEGFQAPETFQTFNRALAARVAAYRQDYEQVLSLLGDSFIDSGAPLDRGAFHIFSTSSGDMTNPFFLDPQASGDLIAAHPSYAADIREDDNRIDKIVERDETFEGAGLQSDWGFAVYDGPTAPIPIVRNAELFLLRAEANLLKSSPDLAAVIDDLNVIRNAAGLGDYSGPETQDALFDELLYQRRYELYGEGHRWIDVRRLLGGDCGSSNDDTCLNDDFPRDREGDDVWLQFPIPADENV
jgi:hypothetical protein